MIDREFRKKLKYFIGMTMGLIGAGAICSIAAVAGKNDKLFTVGAVICAAGAAALLLYGYKKYKTNADNISEFEKNVKDETFIRYDRVKETAVAGRNFENLTGVSAGTFFLSDSEYKAVMKKLKENCVIEDENVYLSAVPDRWIQLRNYSVGTEDVTIISDVSRYMVCKNVIKSLKYYDMSTGVLSREAFISQVRTSSEANTDTIGIIHFIISGLDKVSSFSGTAASDSLIARVASFIKKYDNPHNIFTGRTATNEFSMLVTETYDEGCRKLADKVLKGLKQLIDEVPGLENSSVRIYCGYACFKGNDNNVGTMLSSADFAAFDAESRSISEPVLFNTATYSLRAQEFKKVQVLNKIVMNNATDYHFQPIVNAKTGAVYGYEALMRPRMIDGIKLNPLEVLNISEQQEMLHEIESMTFMNAFRLLSENQETFSSKRLFINCIPTALLSDEDFDRLLDSYSGLFEKIVVEITEGSPVLKDAVETINKRFRTRNAQVALDDYGTGYSNEGTLLSVKPDYVKIDRSLISDIDKDPQKQHLVTNIIDFASHQGILTLGEGIETLEELDTVISLGVDLVQGYLTSKPTAVLMHDIPNEIKNKIISFNLKHTGHIHKTYTITESGEYNVLDLAVNGYDQITVNSTDVTLKGNAEIESCMSIEIDISSEDDSRVKFHDVNIYSHKENILSIAKGTHVNIELSGSNAISRGSVRVPEGASLYFGGKGSLKIESSESNGFGIGGSYTQDFGEIMLDCKGKITVDVHGDSVIGIGGGIGSPDSKIKLISGDVSLVLNGKEIVGVGTFLNEANISINPMNLDITIGGRTAVGVGTKSGRLALDCSANVKTNISGDCCCGMGVIEKGSGTVTVNGGSSDIVVRGKTVTGIGGVGSDTEIILNKGSVSVLCEGDNATCIGDSAGKGCIRCKGAAIKAVAKASKETTLGVADGKIFVTGGSIITSDLEPLDCYSPGGKKLIQVEKDGRKKFTQNIKNGKEKYVYNAEPTKEDVMYIYLPEVIINVNAPRSAK
ncbi:MAG: EAL domain-containing protein [Oscillospiraceae bacterium]|nr:EAL domain-containing protein [Oscillospiraceae bacterium]